MFTRKALIDLIENAPNIGVSLYLPTQTHGRETRQNPIMLKNQLGSAREQLVLLGVSEPEAEVLLAPAVALVEDYDFWQHQDQGLALFLSEAGMQVYKLPMAVGALAHAGRSYFIAPLLPLQEQHAAYLVLSLTADAARVWRATRFSMTAVEVADLPASIEALDEAPDYEGSLHSHGFGRPNTGGHTMPKTQVFGDSPEEWRKGRLVEYAQRAAAAVAAHLAHDPLGVVVIADAEIGGHVLKSGALAPMVAGFVETNPAALDEAGLHAAARAVMQPIHDKVRDGLLERLDAHLGRGDATACTDAAQLIVDAENGKVDQLFLSEITTLTGEVDPHTGSSRITEATAHRTLGGQNLVAQMTLVNGGGVWVVAPVCLPDGVSMAALLRY